MPETVNCTRCSRQAPPPARVLLAPKQAAEVKEKVCADCWAEWQKGEVVVINELRLNFMDPKSQEILERHMREFLFLDGAPAADATPDGAAPSPFDNVTPMETAAGEASDDEPEAQD